MRLKLSQKREKSIILIFLVIQRKCVSWESTTEGAITILWFKNTFKWYHWWTTHIYNMYMQSTFIWMDGKVRKHFYKHWNWKKLEFFFQNNGKFQKENQTKNLSKMNILQLTQRYFAAVGFSPKLSTFNVNFFL